MPYYKLANPQGWDFYTGKTINYREGIGGIVKAPDYEHTPECGHGLHYCVNPNDCFVGARIPCSAYEVEPVGRSHFRIDTEKNKAKSLRILREVTDLDSLFGWRYSGALNPVNPFYLVPPSDVAPYLPTLNTWASVGPSVWASVRPSVRDSVWPSVGPSVQASVGPSVWASVWNSVWPSVGPSVWASIRASIRDSVWASIRDSAWASVWDSVRAYIGSLFPNIKKWKYIDHEPGVYPFQSAVDLWRLGLVPSFDGALWRLHGGSTGEVLWQGSLK